ncbi:MAG: hypothetical protein V4573_18790 [Pseudomonadota bacterium]
MTDHKHSVRGPAPVIQGAARWSDSVRDWLSTLRTSSRQPGAGQSIEPIKQLMLQPLDAPCDGRLTDDDRLRLRVRMCDDVLTLWYMRSELMWVFSARFGEREATLQLARISALFEGLLPAGLAAHHIHRHRVEHTART